MDEHPPKAIRFGSFEMDPVSGDLRKSGIPLKMQPQPCKVLLLLLARPGELVTRERIQEEIWGDATHVDFEKGLNFCIKKIREALIDDAETPRYIETVPKRGYRFIHPVEAVSPEAVGSSGTVHKSRGELPSWAGLLILAGVALTLALTWMLREPPTHSLAVLPLEDLSQGAAPEGFVDGMTDMLTTELSKIKPLRVISRVTMEQYRETDKTLPEIAKDLNVDSVVEGSVLFDGERVRITVQLIDASPERHLWAEAYDREVNDVLELHTEVARTIARQIEGVIIPERDRLPKVTPAALIAYLKGRGFLSQRTPEKIQTGLNYFDQAIALDPAFALAHAGRADAYALLGSVPYDALPPLEAMPLAKRAALRALELDDRLAEAHTTLGYVSMVFDHDWEKAEEEFLRGLNLNPNYVEAHHWYAYYLHVLGRVDEAMEHVEYARQLDPNSLTATASLAWHHYYERDYQQAIVHLKETLEINSYFPLAHLDLGLVYAQLGRYNEASQEFEQALAIAPNCTICRGVKGYNYALAGRIDEAEDILEDLLDLSETRYVPGFYLAVVYGALGQKEEALRWMEKAYEQRSDYIIYAGIEPSLDPIRGEPRFKELLDRIFSASSISK